METKKSPQVDVHRHQTLFRHIGLMLTLAIVLMAFEYKSPMSNAYISLDDLSDQFDPLLEIPITAFPPPPPPKVEQPIIKEKLDDIEIPPIDVILDTNIPEVISSPKIIILDSIAPEETDKIFQFVEEAPSPAGGYEGWVKYLQKSVKYPNQAKKMGISGIVYVSFIVDKDGSISDVSVTRSIGGGCDEEAMRVLKNAPKWNPGKQRGNPVKVRMSLPIKFVLQ